MSWNLVCTFLGFKSYFTYLTIDVLILKCFINCLSFIRASISHGGSPEFHKIFRIKILGGGENILILNLVRRTWQGQFVNLGQMGVSNPQSDILNFIWADLKNPEETNSGNILVKMIFGFRSKLLTLKYCI